jgi:hypothetical protein
MHRGSAGLTSFRPPDILRVKHPMDGPTAEGER